MDTHVFFCCGTRTNSQEKPSICADENGLAMSTLNSLQSFFILSVIVLKNITASLQVSSRSESRYSKRRNLKFRTIEHQCLDSSVGFMAATNDGGSKVGKRSWQINHRGKMNLTNHNETKNSASKQLNKRGKLKFRSTNKNQIIISSNWVSNPLQKINATQVYIHRPNLQQTYQFNFLATISEALKKEAHIIHKYRGKSRLLKFIPPPPKLARKTWQF